MKTRLPHILILTCIAFTAFAGVAYGQDAGLPDYEITDHERDKILNSPGEGDTRYKAPISTSNSSVARDSATLTRSVPAIPVTAPRQPLKSEKQSPPPPKQDDDSILSFNFLYYIIQKYKLQDIID